MTDLTHGQQPSADTQAPAGHVDTEWVCVPCFTMKPRASGHVTVHGTGRGGDPASLTVWCPWCGDRMERAGDCLTDDELAAPHTTMEAYRRSDHPGFASKCAAAPSGTENPVG